MRVGLSTPCTSAEGPRERPGRSCFERDGGGAMGGHGPERQTLTDAGSLRWQTALSATLSDVQGKPSPELGVDAGEHAVGGRCLPVGVSQVVEPTSLSPSVGLPSHPQPGPPTLPGFLPWSCLSFRRSHSVSEQSLLLHNPQNPPISLSWTTTLTSRPASTPNG